MITFSVPEMSCGHCTAAIESAIGAIDKAARVTCDLETHQVSVDGNSAVPDLIAAIKDAGYEARVAG